MTNYIPPYADQGYGNYLTNNAATAVQPSSAWQNFTNLFSNTWDKTFNPSIVDQYKVFQNSISNKYGIVGHQGTYNTLEEAQQAAKQLAQQNSMFSSLGNIQSIASIAQGLFNMYSAYSQNKLAKQALQQAKDQFLFNVQDTNRKYNASLKQYNNAAYDRVTGRASYINGGTDYTGRDEMYNKLKIEG